MQRCVHTYAPQLHRKCTQREHKHVHKCTQVPHNKGTIRVPRAHVIVGKRVTEGAEGGHIGLSRVYVPLLHTLCDTYTH